MQHFANIIDALNKSFSQVVFPELAKHLPDLLFPVLLSYLLVDAFIAENGRLAVFYSHINKRSVPLCRLLHLEAEEDLPGPVEWIYEMAMRLHKEAHFPAGTLLGLADGLQDPGFFFSGEELFLLLPRE